MILLKITLDERLSLHFRVSSCLVGELQRRAEAIMEISWASFGVVAIIALVLFLILPASVPTNDAQGVLRKTSNRLSNPLIGDDGRIYTCSERNAFGFESNGSIAWAIPLNYMCHLDIAPVKDERGQIYFIAEDRVLKIKLSNIGTSETVEIFVGPESTLGESGEIIGVAMSIWSSSLIVNIKNRGLFAYKLYGPLLWSAGPVIYRFGYRQGCKKNVTDCYFTSAPVIDQCEGSAYISNTEGQLYSLSVRIPHFNWIQDFSELDTLFTITPGNNGLVYLIFPRRALLMALDASTGNILWQKNVGPLSTKEYLPVVDSNGWISIGSLDGFLYSFSPTGDLKKFLKATALDSVVQVSPLLDCSGYAVYASQTRMEKKISHTIGEYTYISGTKPISVVFTLLAPSAGAVYWTGRYPGELSSILSESDVHKFALDERILLAFITSAKIGNPLSCHTTRQKLAWSCSQVKPKNLSIYTGDERTILLFLILQFVVLMVLTGSIWFCCIFWEKKKLRRHELGKFLEKRHSLHLKKKTFDKMIIELEQKAMEEAVGDDIVGKLEDMVVEREGIKRKLLTSYSLGRDRVEFRSRSLPVRSQSSLLPLYSPTAKSYSFQSGKKESVTLFGMLSDTSSSESSRSSSSQREVNWQNYEDDQSAVKVKSPIEIGPSSGTACGYGSCESPLGCGTSGSNGFTNPLFVERPLDDESSGMQVHEEKVMEDMQQQGLSSTSGWLKRRAFSSASRHQGES